MANSVYGCAPLGPLLGPAGCTESRIAQADRLTVIKLSTAVRLLMARGTLFTLLSLNTAIVAAQDNLHAFEPTRLPNAWKPAAVRPATQVSRYQTQAPVGSSAANPAGPSAGYALPQMPPASATTGQNATNYPSDTAGLALPTLPPTAPSGASGTVGNGSISDVPNQLRATASSRSAVVPPTAKARSTSSLSDSSTTGSITQSSSPPPVQPPGGQSAGASGFSPEPPRSTTQRSATQYTGSQYTGPISAPAPQTPAAQPAQPAQPRRTPSQPASYSYQNGAATGASAVSQVVPPGTQTGSSSSLRDIQDGQPGRYGAGPGRGSRPPQAVTTGLPYVTPPPGNYMTSPINRAIFQTAAYQPATPASTALASAQQPIGTAVPVQPGVSPSDTACPPGVPPGVYPPPGAVPGTGVPPTITPNMAPTVYAPSNVGLQPLISLGQDRNNVQLGRGIIGQPVAYVPGQWLRNSLRYIFP